MGLFSGIKGLQGGGRVPRNIAILVSILLVLLVLAGTAAAGALVLPRQVARLTQILSEEGGAAVAQAGRMYSQGLADLAGAFGVGSQGDAPTGGTGSSGTGGLGPVSPKVYRPGAERPLQAPLALLGSGSGTPTFVQQSGSVVGSSGPLSGPSTSSTGTTDEKKTTTPSTPTKATPIPGAVWLLGAGVAGLMAAKRRQEKKVGNDA